MVLKRTGWQLVLFRTTHSQKRETTWCYRKPYTYFLFLYVKIGRVDIIYKDLFEDEMQRKFNYFLWIAYLWEDSGMHLLVILLWDQNETRDFQNLNGIKLSTLEGRARRFYLACGKITLIADIEEFAFFFPFEFHWQTKLTGACIL